jgi:hypothetical protein
MSSMFRNKVASHVNILKGKLEGGSQDTMKELKSELAKQKNPAIRSLIEADIKRRELRAGKSPALSAEERKSIQGIIADLESAHGKMSGRLYEPRKTAKK